MTKFSKATLILSGIMLAVIAEAAVISSAWTGRGFFAVGGEWLVPAVVWGVYIAGREIRRLYRTVRSDFNG